MRTIIYITGPTSSGKSTASRRLSSETGIPVFHADHAYEIIQKEYNVPVHPAKLTNHALWGNPRNFGIESWNGSVDMNDAKSHAYSILFKDRVIEDSMIEGFTVSFLDERRLIREIIGPHISVLFRLNLDYEKWLKLFLKKFEEKKAPERLLYDRLRNCFQAEEEDAVFEFRDPSEITKSSLNKVLARYQ